MTAQTPGCGSNSEARKRAAEAEDPHGGCTPGKCKAGAHHRAVTCSELAAIDIEVGHLRRWKAEALPLFDGLQDLGRALDLPLGARITGPRAVSAAAALRDERDELAAAVDAVRRRHPRGDEEPGPLAPGLWCPTCGRERTDGGRGGCPDREALTTTGRGPRG